MSIKAVPVLSAQEYWDKYIVKGLDEKKSTEFIRRQLVEAIKLEVGMLIRFRTKSESMISLEHTPENERIIQNAAKQAMHKWANLCKRCRMYKETVDICRPEDLVFGRGDLV